MTMNELFVIISIFDEGYVRNTAWTLH